MHNVNPFLVARSDQGCFRRFISVVIAEQGDLVRVMKRGVIFGKNFG